MDQGLANRLCTIANSMFVATLLRCGVVIVWTHDNHCPCWHTEVIDVTKIQCDEIPFIKWFNTDVQVVNAGLEREQMIHKFTSYFPVEAWAALFRQAHIDHFTQQGREPPALPLNNHMGCLCDALKLHSS